MSFSNFFHNSIIQVTLILCSIFIHESVCTAQSKIVGQVVDKTGKAIVNANVLLLKSVDSSLVKGMVSSQAGTYSFENIAPGNYLISSTCASHAQRYTSRFSVGNNKTQTDLGQLKLMEATLQLGTVKVTARRPVFEQKIDRLVINVENSITAAGNTALDVLERSPGVIIDRQNNTISMNGKDGVVIMMNGKLTNMPIAAAVQMLAGMSSGNIDKIELITTPPANFDAEGNAGFINIVLKSNDNVGTNGSYSATLGYGQGLVSGANISLNHRKGKINVYSDLNFSQVKTTPLLAFTRRTSNNGVITEMYSSTDRHVTQTNFTGRLGVDYQLSRRTIIGALFSTYNNKFSMTALNHNTIKKDDQLDTTINIVNYETNRWKNYSGNLNLQHNFNDDERLSLNVDNIYYTNNQPVEYFNSYYNNAGTFIYQEDTRSGKNTPINLFVSALDYSKKLSKKVTMESGAKFTNSGFTNDVTYEKHEQSQWVKQPAGTAKYKLDEKYAAVYTSFSIAFNEKTSIKAGVRYEYTVSNLGTAEIKNIVDRQYGNFFPSFFLSRKLDDNNSVNFSYTRRITRPTFNALAPFTYYSNPYSLITGNPALQPAIANMVKGDYIFRKYMISISYTKEDNAITGFQPKIDSVTNKMVASPENLVDQKIVSLIISVPVEVNKWWSMQYNITGLAQRVNALYKKEPVTLQQANFRINATQKFKLPKEFSIELSGFYQSRSLNGISVMQQYGSLDLGIRKSLSNKKGTLVLNGSNLLNTFLFRPFANLPEQNLYNRGNLRFFSRTVKLTYSRNFGNNKLKSKRERPTAGEEEKGRVQAQ
ncbi:MAG: TonB-dependent receptor [Ferruginibacter sp.]